MLRSHGTANSTGVCICFRYNLEHKVIKVISDAEGRYNIANMEIQTHQTLKQDRLKHFEI